MRIPEETTHSFVVRVWLEKEASDTSAAVWRGHVTHVLTGKRRAFKAIDELCTFLSEFLAGLNATPKA